MFEDGDASLSNIIHEPMRQFAISAAQHGTPHLEEF